MASTTGNSGLASRYALALYALADEQKKLDQVADDLRNLDSALRESEDLRRVVRSPVVSRAAQGKAVAALAEKLEADALTRNFLGLAAANRRLFALPDMIGAFLAELARRRGEVTAQVTTARTLSDEQTKAVEDALRKVVGAKVALSMSVDPALIGGMIVKVGSRMVDSSLKTQLERLRYSMKGAA